MGNEFDHRNLWLQLVLGLLAAGERLDVILARYAPERGERAGAPDDSDRTAAAGDEVLTAFVLGLVACRDHLHDVLEEAACDLPTPAQVATPHAVRSHELRSLLR